MPDLPDIRWQQRLQNFSKALDTLRQAVQLAARRPLSDLEKQGLIQGFEFTHELAWNVLKDYLEAQGYQGLIGSRNATREAFRNALIEEGQTWMDMIKARNLSSHTYHAEVAEAVAEDILTRFFPAFAAMESRFAQIAATEDRDPR